MKFFNIKTRTMIGNVLLLHLAMEEIQITVLKCIKKLRSIETLVKMTALVKSSFYKILASKVKMTKQRAIVELIKEF